MDDPSSIAIAGRLVAVILLVLANGFFVAAEFSLVAIRRSRVEQLLAEGHPLAPAVQRAVSQLDSYLAATQLGITMASNSVQHCQSMLDRILEKLKVKKGCYLSDHNTQILTGQ